MTVEPLLQVAQLAKNDPLHLLGQIVLQHIDLLSVKVDHLHRLVQLSLPLLTSIYDCGSGCLGAVGTRGRESRLRWLESIILTTECTMASFACQ